MLTAAAFALLSGLPSSNDSLTLCRVTVPDIVRQAAEWRLMGVDQYAVGDHIAPRIPAGVNDPVSYGMLARAVGPIYAQFAYLYGTQPEAYTDPAFLRHAASMAESACLDAVAGSLPTDD